MLYSYTTWVLIRMKEQQKRVSRGKQPGNLDRLSIFYRFCGIGRGTSLTMFCPIISKFEAILQLVEKKMYPKYGGNMGETGGNGANEG